jgi:hypothetical protein
MHLYILNSSIIVESSLSTPKSNHLFCFLILTFLFSYFDFFINITLLQLKVTFSQPKTITYFSS